MNHYLVTWKVEVMKYSPHEQEDIVAHETHSQLLYAQNGPFARELIKRAYPNAQNIESRELEPRKKPTGVDL